MIVESIVAGFWENLRVCSERSGSSNSVVAGNTNGQMEVRNGNSIS